MDNIKQLDFSKALLFLKMGKVVKRVSWSGNKSIFLENNMGGVLPFLCINTKDGNKGVYTATSCDILATDWIIVNK